MVGMIPEGTFYIKGSATGEKREHEEWEAKEIELHFSIDGGISFSKPPLCRRSSRRNNCQETRKSDRLHGHPVDLCERL